MLTEKEKEIILREVEMDGGSTMGLNALSEGSEVEVPLNIRSRNYSNNVAFSTPSKHGA